MPFQWRQNVLHSATVRVKDVDLHIKMCHASQSSFVFASITACVNRIIRSSSSSTQQLDFV